MSAKSSLGSTENKDEETIDQLRARLAAAEKKEAEAKAAKALEASQLSSAPAMVPKPSASTAKAHIPVKVDGASQFKVSPKAVATKFATPVKPAAVVVAKPSVAARPKEEEEEEEGDEEEPNESYEEGEQGGEDLYEEGDNGPDDTGDATFDDYTARQKKVVMIMTSPWKGPNTAELLRLRKAISAARDDFTAGTLDWYSKKVKELLESHQDLLKTRNKKVKPIKMEVDEDEEKPRKKRAAKDDLEVPLVGKKQKAVESSDSLSHKDLVRLMKMLHGQFVVLESQVLACKNQLKSLIDYVEEE